MEQSFNVVLIALERKERDLDIRYFKTMDSAQKFKEELINYDGNSTVLGIFKREEESNHSWETLIYDKVLKRTHRVFVKSKKECKIVARMFLEYENKYNITFKKIY